MTTPMTSRERLVAAYAHKPVDRIPCSPRLWAWLLERYGNSDTNTLLRVAAEFDFDPHVNISVFDEPVGLHCSPHIRLAKVQCRQTKRQEHGFTVIRRVFKTPEGILTDETRVPPHDRSFGIGPNPVRTEHLVKAPADLKRLRYLIPDRSKTSFQPYFTEERRVGQRGLVSLAVLSPLCHRAADACAMEELMMAWHTDRQFFDELLHLFHREMMQEIRLALSAGVRYFSANWYENSLSAGWSPKIWQQSFAPQLLELTTAIHNAGGKVNLYDDGKCAAILELLADCGVDVLQTLTPPPVGDVDLADAKRRIGHRVCLMGHTDLLYVLLKGTPALVEQTVREAMQVGAPGGGFILGTSDSVRDGTPPENIRTYFQAARKYGIRYAIKGPRRTGAAS